MYILKCLGIRYFPLNIGIGAKSDTKMFGSPTFTVPLDSKLGTEVDWLLELDRVRCNGLNAGFVLTSGCGRGDGLMLVLFSFGFVVETGFVVAPDGGGRDGGTSNSVPSFFCFGCDAAIVTNTFALGFVD